MELRTGKAGNLKIRLEVLAEGCCGSAGAGQYRYRGINWTDESGYGILGSTSAFIVIPEFFALRLRMEKKRKTGEISYSGYRSCFMVSVICVFVRQRAVRQGFWQAVP